MRFLAITTIFAMQACAAPMTTTDREHLIAHLEMTETWLADEVSDLTEAQLKFRPAPGKWTILDVVEHLTIAEPQYWHDLKDSMSKPPAKAANREATDLYVLWYGIDRTEHQKTGEAREPKGTLTDARAGMSAVHKLRTEMLAYARTTDEDLRAHTYGGGDVYQWFVMISTHMQRHILQIREVKASAGYPKASPPAPR
jgi:DinB superfamily